MTSESTESRKRILYVDDMSISLKAFKKALEAHYEIFLADSISKMYKIMDRIRPDLIILDVNMPGTGGYDIIIQLKDDTRYSDIPVMFMTGNSDKESVSKGLSLGAVAYAVKPFNALKLVETINSQLYPRVIS